MRIVPLWAKGLIVLAVLTAAYAGVKVFENRAYDRGYDARDLEAQATEARITKESLERFNKAAAEAKTREDKLRSDLAAADKKRYEDNKRHEKTISSLIARANAGDIGLRVNVNGNSISGCAGAAFGSVTAGSSDETRADLMPGTVATVLRLAGDSARDVRRYNDLVDRYERARETCNREPMTAEH